MDTLSIELFTDDHNTRLLCELYWKINDDGSFVYPVTQIAQRFGLTSSKATDLVKRNSRATSGQYECSNCGVKYTYHSRSDYQQRIKFSLNTWKCDNCLRSEDEERKVAKIKLDQKRREILRSILNISNQPLIHPNTLSLKDAVYYLSLIRLGASEDFKQIRSLLEFPTSLSPSKKYDLEIIRHLFERKLIGIHPESPLSAFSFNDAEISFFDERVCWVPLVAHQKDKQKLAFDYLEDLFMSAKWMASWEQEFLEIGKRISLEECLQYLNYCLEQHSLPFKVGEKTEIVLRKSLEFFSVAQTYSFIWRAAKDAAAFYVRKSVTKQHAANTVVGSIERMIENARDNKWDISSFGRSYEFPQTAISHVLFSTVLHLGDGGFTMPALNWSIPVTDRVPRIILQDTAHVNKQHSSKSASKSNPNNHDQTMRRSNRKKKRKK